MKEKLPNLITILGPTASGKSSLGIELALKFNGEIISADSRQVYRKMNIGTGKVTKEEQNMIKHHLLDVVGPNENFSLAHFQPLAFAAIDDILNRNKLPFLVGGTALYIYSVIDNYNLSNVGANAARRKELEKLSADELSVIASAALAKRSNLNNMPGSDDQIATVSLAELGFPRNDTKNPRRLIRAIEKLEAGFNLESKKNPPKYENLIFGINPPKEELIEKIDKRVDQRIEQGMIEEVSKLRKIVPDEKLISFGLEYKFITEHLQGKNSKQEMTRLLKNAIHSFSKRQMTWFKKDKRIIWIENSSQAEETIKKSRAILL